MNSFPRIILTALFALSAAAVHADSTSEPNRGTCTISVAERSGTLRLQTDFGECEGGRSCGNNSDMPWSRFRGISVADLANPGSKLTATLKAEAGTLTCSGEVEDGALHGHSQFVPNADFAARMAQMGFSGLDNDKMQAYTFVNVESAWVRSLQETNVRGLNADNLIALRVFNTDADYIRSMTALGYDMPNADQLVAMKSQGVNPEEVKEIRALGYQPTVDELIQIRIFKITPDFIHRMEARGFKNLTIGKLVQIRIFKLAE